MAKSSGLVDVSQHLHLFPLSLWFDSILHSTLSITKPNVSRNRWSLQLSQHGLIFQMHSTEHGHRKIPPQSSVDYIRFNKRLNDWMLDMYGCSVIASRLLLSWVHMEQGFFPGDGVMLSGLFLDCRCYRCENESKWLDSQTGIRCFIIIYFRYRYCSCFRYWWRIGVRRTWSRICAYLDFFLKMGGELRTLTPRRL